MPDSFKEQSIGVSAGTHEGKRMVNIFPLEEEKQLDRSGVGPTETIRVTPGRHEDCVMPRGCNVAPSLEGICSYPLSGT